MLEPEYLAAAFTRFHHSILIQSGQILSQSYHPVSWNRKLLLFSSFCTFFPSVCLTMSHVFNTWRIISKIFNSLLSLFLTISMFYIHTRYLDSWPFPTGVTFIHWSFIPLHYFHLQINNDRLLVFCHFHYENFIVIKHRAVYCNFVLQFRSNTMFFCSKIHEINLTFVLTYFIYQL